MSHQEARREALAAARSLLFVPGNRPDRFGKALRSGADAIVLDLEDSVPPADKAAARHVIETAWPELQGGGLPLIVRINAPDDVPGREDVAWVRSLDGPAAIMVPKADSADRLAAIVEGRPDLRLLPLVETALGYAAVPQIAAAPGVLRLAIGHIDFMADLGLQCSDDEQELAPLRFAVAVATRLQRLAPALDGVTTSIDDDARLRTDTLRALRFGFGGKLCIHPRQIAIVHETLAPSAEEVEFARRVIAADTASGGAAVRLDGRMVDLPVVLQARRILSRARGARLP